MKNRDKKVKLLFVLPALDSGGAERVLINLMNAVDSEQYEPSFLSVRNDGELGSLIAQDIPRYCLNAKRFVFCLPGLYKTLRMIRPDVVVSTMAHMNFAVLLMKPFFPKTKFLVREAITPSYFINKYPYGGWIIRAFYRCLYPLADRVLSPTQIVFDEFDALFGKDWMKPFLLYNPVDKDAIRDSAVRDWPSSVDKGAVRFVACGRLVPQKGFDRLIKTLAKAQLPTDWTLEIFGMGFQREELEKLIYACGLNDRVKLLGLVLKPYGHFAAADCFLLPSRFEGLPNVVLESLACGTPVIATRESGGIAEIAAASGNSGAVTITDTMEQFAGVVAKVKAMDKHAPAPSLLPSEFERESIIRRFHALLDETVPG